MTDCWCIGSRSCSKKLVERGISGSVCRWVHALGRFTGPIEMSFELFMIGGFEYIWSWIYMGRAGSCIDRRWEGAYIWASVCLAVILGLKRHLHIEFDVLNTFD